MNAIEVTVTCGSVEEARRIMGAAVGERLAACGQTWPIESCFRWDGEVTTDREHLVLLKTVETHFDALCELIRSLHSYELPAIVAIPLAATGPGYDDWLAASTSS